MTLAKTQDDCNYNYLVFNPSKTWEWKYYYLSKQEVQANDFQKNAKNDRNNWWPEQLPKDSLQHWGIQLWL